MNDVKSPAALALRALQKYDQLQSTPIHRDLLLDAMTYLGEVLGLDCTGVAEGGGFYDHAGDTCPVHEWLVPVDRDIAERLGLGLPA